MSFAKVQIVGNLGRDPEVRYTQNGTMNVQFTMAVNGRRRGGNQDQGGNDQENTTWFRVTAWDKAAERLTNMVERGYIAKGRTLYVDGTLESRQYTDNSGQQRNSLEVTLTDWQFVGSRQDNQGGDFGGGNRAGGSYGGGNQNNRPQGDDFSGNQSYGGSNYGNSYGGGQNDFSDDDQGSMNDVPF